MICLLLGDKIIFSAKDLNVEVELFLLNFNLCFAFSICSFLINFSYFDIADDFKAGKESVFSLNFWSFKNMFNDDKYFFLFFIDNFK